MQTPSEEVPGIVLQVAPLPHFLVCGSQMSKHSFFFVTHCAPTNGFMSVGMSLGQGFDPSHLGAQILPPNVLSTVSSLMHEKAFGSLPCTPCVYHTLSQCVQAQAQDKHKHKHLMSTGTTSAHPLKHVQ